MSKKMDEYFKKKPPSLPNSNSSTIESSHPLVTIESVPNPSTSSMEPEPVDVPTPLSDLNSRAPCQPRLSDFSKTKQGKQHRSFDPSWYKNRDWLEYSVTANACFCFPCRVFGVNLSTNAFTETGYRDWKHSLYKGKGFSRCHLNMQQTFLLGEKKSRGKHQGKRSIVFLQK